MEMAPVASEKSPPPLNEMKKLNARKIKIVKRFTGPLLIGDHILVAAAHGPAVTRKSVTGTVKEWISERRVSSQNESTFSRNKISAWNADSPH